jgi:hypothetical protein
MIRALARAALHSISSGPRSHSFHFFHPQLSCRAHLHPPSVLFLQERHDGSGGPHHQQEHPVSYVLERVLQRHPCKSGRTNHSNTLKLHTLTPTCKTLNQTQDVIFNADDGFQEIYSLFSLHEKVSVVGSRAPNAPPPVCSSQALAGGLAPPPVQDFVFAGEQPFPPESSNMVWIWKLGALVYVRAPLRAARRAARKKEGRSGPPVPPLTPPPPYCLIPFSARRPPSCRARSRRRSSNPQCCSTARRRWCTGSETSSTCRQTRGRPLFSRRPPRAAREGRSALLRGGMSSPPCIFLHCSPALRLLSQG